MEITVRPDARKTLKQLRGEWDSCIKCSLGHSRIERGGSFVFGYGMLNAIMLIGEGPGFEEEKNGIPFSGKSGTLLHKVLKLIGLTDFYISNLVTCRSCSQQLDEDGAPRMRMNYVTKLPELAFKDEPPTPPQYNACLPRLCEEIYLVDPIVIVGLGGSVCEALTGGHVTITRQRGETVQIEIPGASFVPDLTERKEAWLRRDGSTPIVQNTVRYHFIQTLHPAYVIRKLADRGEDSPLRYFVADLKKALKTYEAYRETVYGILPTAVDTDDEAIQQQISEDA
jgi:DNA polymerase